MLTDTRTLQEQSLVNESDRHEICICPESALAAADAHGKMRSQRRNVRALAEENFWSNTTICPTRACRVSPSLTLHAHVIAHLCGAFHTTRCQAAVFELSATWSRGESQSRVAGPSQYQPRRHCDGCGVEGSVSIRDMHKVGAVVMEMEDDSR